MIGDLEFCLFGIHRFFVFFSLKCINSYRKIAKLHIPKHAEVHACVREGLRTREASESFRRSACLGIWRFAIFLHKLVHFRGKNEITGNSQRNISPNLQWCPDKDVRERKTAVYLSFGCLISIFPNAILMLRSITSKKLNSCTKCSAIRWDYFEMKGTLWTFHGQSKLAPL